MNCLLRSTLLFVLILFVLLCFPLRLSIALVALSLGVERICCLSPYIAVVCVWGEVLASLCCYVTISLFNNNIGPEGAAAIAEALKHNSTLFLLE